MDLFIFILCLSLSYYLAYVMQPCGHLLGKGKHLGSPVCDVFLCFCHFLFGILGQVWYLIVSIHNLLTLYFQKKKLKARIYIKHL